MTLIDGVFAYYNLNGNSIDISGNGNNGIDNNISYVSGLINQAASFNGTNSRIDTGITPLATQTTVLYLNNADTDRFMEIFGAYDGVNFNTFHSLTYDSRGATNKLQFQMFNDFITIEGLSFNAFHQIVICYTPTSLCLYVDSVEVNTISKSGYVSGSTLKLGYFNSQSQDYAGLIDEVGIWDRILSQAEITELWNGGAGLSYPFEVTPSASKALFFSHNF